MTKPLHKQKILAAAALPFTPLGPYSDPSAFLVAGVQDLTAHDVVIGALLLEVPSLPLPTVRSKVKFSLPESEMELGLPGPLQSN